uniref:uncharacterized protein LOC122610312 n=1 Tax=Erigeron canadensis TaxID=72917 RepID=UPI001CB91CF1|nr:uncharacterized protein LOC122610312 [Erigeron canadensis]
MWYDKWNDIGPLSNHISLRVITRSGFSLVDSVADLIDESTWRWPTAWLDLFPVLIHYKVPNINPMQNNVVVWCTSDGTEAEFLASSVWDSIRSKGGEVDWVNIVWFSKCPDSHDHLFFECPFSALVWSLVQNMAELHGVPNKLTENVYRLYPISKGNSTKSIIGRLVFAATSYYVWQERNARMFGNVTRPPEILKNIILDSVRLKLASLKFKGSDNTRRLIEKWKLPQCLMLES